MPGMIRVSGRPLLLFLLVALLGGSGRAEGQGRRPTSQVAVDLDLLGTAVSYARGGRDGPYWGAQAGLGGSFLSRMLLAGRHFADEDGPSYGSRDGAVDKKLYEVVHLAVFRRWDGSDRWSADAGGRTSVFVHTDSSDDEPALPVFVGFYGSFLVGTRHVKVGPHLLVGYFTEGSSANELGVYLVPLSGRITFGW